MNGINYTKGTISMTHTLEGSENSKRMLQLAAAEDDPRSKVT